MTFLDFFEHLETFWKIIRHLRHSKLFEDIFDILRNFKIVFLDFRKGSILYRKSSRFFQIFICRRGVFAEQSTKNLTRFRQHRLFQRFKNGESYRISGRERGKMDRAAFRKCGVRFDLVPTGKPATDNWANASRWQNAQGTWLFYRNGWHW